MTKIVQLSGSYAISESSVIESDLNKMINKVSGASVFVIPDYLNSKIARVGVVQWG